MLLRAVLKAQIYFVSHRFLDEKFLVLGWHRNHDETRIKLTRLRCRRGGRKLWRKVDTPLVHIARSIKPVTLITRE